MSVSNQRLQGVRIARVSTVIFFIETQLRSQISAMAQAGAQVTVVASEQSLAIEIPGARYVSIEIPRKIDPLRDLVALIRLWSFFRRSSFEIVHSTTPKAGLLCSLAARLAGVPVRVHTFTGQPWVGLSGFKRFLAKGGEKLISRLNTHCYTDSHSQRNFIIENGIARPGQISVLGAGSVAGIDLQRFNPARFTAEDRCGLKSRLGIPQDARVLLFVGRLTRDKGIVELLAAFARVVASGADVFLLMLGPRDETDIDALLDEFPPALRARLIMPGFSHEPEQFMSIACMLLLPSYREGFGTAVIEAAAMGIPTIGSDIYGLTDAIVDGQTGLLVPVRNVDTLVAAIETLLKDPDLRQKMGRAARARVEKEFSCTRVNDLVIGEYVELLARSRARP